MKYRDLIDARQSEFNKLPIFFAFGQKHFDEACRQRGFEPSEAREKLFRLSDTGGYYLKEDAEVVRAFMTDDWESRLRQMMEEDLSLAREAFEYEMANHEYPINMSGDWDVCSQFGVIEWAEEKNGTDYLEELGFSEKVIREYHKARVYVSSTMEW